MFAVIIACKTTLLFLSESYALNLLVVPAFIPYKGLK